MYVCETPLPILFVIDKLLPTVEPLLSLKKKEYDW